jgi:L-aminopeptidase/D-esterase-like protein
MPDLPSDDMPSNDTLTLTPATDFSGPALSFDFPGLQIGVAEYAEGPTGCTIFHVQKGAALDIDVRGGAVGLAGGEYHWTHAICLAGGSLYGLEAVAGVTAEIFARQGHRIAGGSIPLVSGAIIYDFGQRQNAIYPDKALGRAALHTSREGWFPLGPRGAGRSARVGGASPISTAPSRPARARRSGSSGRTRSPSLRW